MTRKDELHEFLNGQGMRKGKRARKSLSKFILLVLGFSVPFWFAGTIIDRFFPSAIPIHLPFAAAMFVCPTIAAAILVSKENGPEAVKRLLARAWDFSKIHPKTWLLSILLFWPVMTGVEYVWLKTSGAPLPAPHAPDWVAPVSFVLFLIGAAGEELGWLGYALEPLQIRFGALGASLVLGLLRAAWHIIPFIQAHNPPQWIVWQCLFTVASQVVTVWFYNASGKSLFTAMVVHAMYNVVSVVFPNYGFSYDPMIFFVLTTIMGIIAAFLWSPRTLADYRFSRQGHTL